jgi:hypothetical protein
MIVARPHTGGRRTQTFTIMDLFFSAVEHIAMSDVIPLHAPGDNRSKQGRWTQLILPVSGCDINASVRVLSNPFSAPADLVTKRP